MTVVNVESALAAINGAQLYYEIAGEGPGLVMIHAGVADSRQWNHEFQHFSGRFRVLRYDMRGYGQSEPVEGEYNNMADLTALLDYLHFDAPVVIMGCSMGGGLAMDLALAEPSRVKALIMVGSGPDGLKLDAPEPEEFEHAEAAYKAGDLDLLAEIETHIWFDGIGRSPIHINPVARKLAYEMNRLALGHEAKKLGKRLPNIQPKAAERLDELKLPILAIVGSYDIPYMQAAVDYMQENLDMIRVARIDHAAHLPNMDQPDEFREIVEDFLNSLD